MTVRYDDLASWAVGARPDIPVELRGPSGLQLSLPLMWTMADQQIASLELAAVIIRRQQLLAVLWLAVAALWVGTAILRLL